MALVIIMILILSTQLSFMMASTTFVVARVEVSNNTHLPIDGITQADLLRWKAKDQNLSLENFQLNYPIVEDLNGENARINNAFVATVFKAYSQHYPLEISVEDIWVIIAQGIGIHLNQNAEKYRHLMVSHQGKKEIKLNVDDLRLSDSARRKHGDKSIPTIDWSIFVQRMSQLIKEDMKMDLTSIMTTSFSNTTSIEQTVFDCTLMDIVKNYYDYRAVLLCGIPRVTLRGSPDDFQQVIDRLNQLREIFSDFHWWLDLLIPHIKKLKGSAEGHPDIDWWRKICHHINEGSGSSLLTGWIADFIPYVVGMNGNYRKTRLDRPYDEQDYNSAFDLEDLSESVTQTDFILDDNGYETKRKLIAGFLGIGQNPMTGALRPSLGWITAIPIDT